MTSTIGDHSVYISLADDERGQDPSSITTVAVAVSLHAPIVKCRTGL